MIRPFFMLLLMALPLFSFAESKKTVKVETAGTLPSLISEDEKFTITDLTLSGQLNGDDLRFLREMAGNDVSGNPTKGNVTKLDMTDANIVAGGGNYIDTNEIRDSQGSMSSGMHYCYSAESDKLGDYLFAGCDKLKEIKLPHSITAIGNYVFYFGASLKSLVIPKNVKSIGEGICNFCRELSLLDVEEGNTVFSSPEGSNAIIKDKTLVLGCSTTKLEDNTINTIGSYAFSSVGWNDNKYTIPLGVKTINHGAFLGCGFTTIDFPDGLETIRDYAFNSSAINELVLPSTVTSIGNCAFRDCQWLKRIISYIKDPSKVEMGYDAFKNIPTDAILFVPEGTIELYESITAWKAFSAIYEISSDKKTVHVETAGTLSSLISEDEKFTITDFTLSGRLNGDDLLFLREMVGNDINGNPTRGCVKILDMSEANIVSGGGYYIYTSEIRDSKGNRTAGTNWHCKAEVNKIGDCLFAGCDHLEEIGLPQSITTIGDRVFYFGSCLKSLTIPQKVTSIGTQLLWECKNLKTLDVDAKNKTFKSPAGSNAVIKDKTLVLGCLYTNLPDNTINAIDPYVFCTGYQPGIQSDADFKIPSGVTTIDHNAFDGCGFNSIDIPESVTSVGDWAFAYSGNLSKLICRITDLSKVKVGTSIFVNVPLDAVLYVPKGMIEIYKTTSPWHRFKDIREIGSGGETPIQAIDTPASDASVYYNLQGQRVEHPTKGLYIKNGKKVLIK